MIPSDESYYLHGLPIPKIDDNKGVNPDITSYIINYSTNNNNIFGNCQVLDKTIRKLVSTYTTKNWFKGCLQ